MKLFSNFLVVASAASFIALTGCSSDASDDTTDSGEVHSDTGHDHEDEDHEDEDHEDEDHEGEDEEGEEGGEEGEE